MVGRGNPQTGPLPQEVAPRCRLDSSGRGGAPFPPSLTATGNRVEFLPMRLPTDCFVVARSSVLLLAVVMLVGHICVLPTHSHVETALWHGGEAQPHDTDEAVHASSCEVLPSSGLRKNSRVPLRPCRVAAPHPRAIVPFRHDCGSAGRRCGLPASPQREEEHSTGPLRSSQSAASLEGTLHGSPSPSRKEEMAHPRDR